MNNNYLDALSRVQEAEAKEKSQQFLAPVVRRGRVRLSVCGIVKDYRLFKHDFEGWGIFRISTNNPDKVHLVEEAPPAMVRDYCKQLLTAPFTLIDEIDGAWYGLQQSTGKRGLLVETPVEIKLLQRPAQFASVIAGFDGTNFWYAAPGKRPPKVAQVLREHLAADLPEDKLAVSGLLQADRVAYKMNLLRKIPKSAYLPNSGMSEKERIELALQQAGARLDSFWGNNQTVASVRFEHEGVMRTVTVRRDNLTVVSSGICLSGRDSDFDLTSVVGVLGSKTRRDTMADDDDDW